MSFSNTSISAGRHARGRLRGRARCGAGFTLVELLIVIGIIGVLVSLLMPALSGVRQQAQATKCAVNLRSLATGWQYYVSANKGVVPPGRLPTAGALNGVYGLGDDDQYRPRWYELLGAAQRQFATHTPKQIEDDSWTIENQMFLCPSVEWNNSRNYPFGYNYQFLGNARPKPDGKMINYPVMSNRINASQTVMAMDSMGTAAGKPKDARTAHYNDGTKDLAAWGNKGWAVDPPRLAGSSDYADRESRNPPDRSGPDPRHKGKLNVAFCDGHVETLAPQDLGYVVSADGAQGVTAPAHNKMFSGTGRDDDPPSVE